ncbi:MAG: calcium-binding protein [Trichodesmium sp. MO_231.B1]|nr:calcium-binding protein [Trichodesmium sp. MO_231.B1]
MVDIILTDGPDVRNVSQGELGPGDSLFALRGNDNVTGSSSNEIMFGGKDNDVIRGGGGNDEINGNNEGDVVTGDAGDDTVRGGKGSDIVTGGLGNDFVYGDRGQDMIVGNGGADTFVLFADSTLPPGNPGAEFPLEGDQLLDFNPGEGDQIGLIGLTANDLTFNSISTRSREFLPLLPPGITTDVALGEFGLGAVFESIGSVSQTGPLDGIQIIANGQVIATVFSTERFLTEADILSSITTVNL